MAPDWSTATARPLSAATPPRRTAQSGLPLSLPGSRSGGRGGGGVARSGTPADARRAGGRSAAGRVTGRALPSPPPSPLPFLQAASAPAMPSETRVRVMIGVSRITLLRQRAATRVPAVAGRVGPQIEDAG